MIQRNRKIPRRHARHGLSQFLHDRITTGLFGCEIGRYGDIRVQQRRLYQCGDDLCQPPSTESRYHGATHNLADQLLQHERITTNVPAWLKTSTGMDLTHCLGGLAIALIGRAGKQRSEEHPSELQSLMRISYAGFCLKKKTNKHID